jgi:hypothetical protein
MVRLEIFGNSSRGVPPREAKKKERGISALS